MKTHNSAKHAKNSKHSIRKITSFILAVAVMMASFACLTTSDSYAATSLPSLTDKSVYYTPNSEYNSGDCILTASKMMLRRAAIMKGSLVWTEITNTSLRPYAQVNGLLRDSYSYTADGVTYSITCKHFTSSTVSDRISEIKTLLKAHPEGIVSWGSSAGKTGAHGVLVVDVTSSGVVKVADSTHNRGTVNYGIEDWSNSTMLAVNKCTTYWYIKKTSGTAKSSEGTVESTLRISGVSAPKTLNVGTPFTIRGYVESNYLINKVTVEVVKSNGTVAISKSATPNAWNFDIHDLDSVVKFGTLAAGSYKYRITATDEKKTAVLYEENLVISDPNAPGDTDDDEDEPVTPVDPSDDKDTDDEITESSDNINIEDFDYPTKLTVGRDFTFHGTIKSDVKLTEVEVSVTSTTGAERLSATASPGETMYDIKDLNSSIDFGTLENGTYSYNVIASTASGSKVVLSKKFRVR